MSKNRFAGMPGHGSNSPRTVNWLTPRAVIGELHRVMGRPYGTDPCTIPNHPWPTASRNLTIVENGLILPWDGDAFVNPPYTATQIARWLCRLADHGNGMGLIFARTDTDAFFEHVWQRADAALFMRGRLTFCFGERWQDPKTESWYEIGDEAPYNCGAPTVLCAYGKDQVEVLAAIEAAGNIQGHFNPLRFPRSVLVALFTPSDDAEKCDITWREALQQFYAQRTGPVELSEIYAAFADHPKCAGNRNVEAKLRQQLQRGNYRRVDRGLWEQAP